MRPTCRKETVRVVSDETNNEGWWLPEEDSSDRSGHRRKKIGERAKGHTIAVGTVDLKKKIKKKFKMETLNY